MDKQEMEKCASVEDGSHLNRNRSFKTKQLVRSQAIRESTSPPRTVSPSVRNDATSDTPPKNVNKVNVKVTAERTSSDSSHDSDGISYNDRKERRKPVEIQITQGAWDENPPYEHRGRTKRWLSDSSRDSARDLLSNNPRVACICGACSACPHCRGRRRRHICTIKQDSGICPDECPECSDPESNGNNDVRKTGSLDVEDSNYCRCPDRRDKPKNTLSRTDSDEKSEPTGQELVTFLKETLNKSGKDRLTLLKVEKELHSLVNDTGRCIVKFPVMTSYGRMLVHRCASLFQLSHHLDQSNKNCVIVSKIGTCGGRIPCTNFKTWCVANFPPPSPQRHATEQIIDGANAKSILKRDTHSLDEPSSGSLAMNRSKSLEQREKEYERVRRRIFSTDNCNQDESQCPWLSAGPVKLLAPEPGRNKLLKVQSLETSGPPANWRGRGGAVSKSHSFGGYGEPQPTRALSRQGDLASSSWRLSPSSSGYKTLSLRSTDSVTPSPTGGGTPEPCALPPAAPAAPAPPAACGAGPVVWCVTDMACVPPGALVIHPQTGRPLTNADGSVYHFDPNNPPILYDPGEYEELEQTTTVEQSNEKRRGRLEKQHSFIDHEGECQQAEQYHYEYEIHETQEIPTEKEPTKPVTPTKTRYEQSEFTHQTEQTNQTAEVQESANQKQYESRGYEPTNHSEVKAGSYQDTVYYGPYASLNQGYNEEVQSSQIAQYMQPDLSMQNMIPQAKVQPVLQDPNMRAMSLTNVVYPNSIPPGYQYVPNPTQCRVEPLQQQLLRYQPVLQQQQIEEQKIPSPTQQAPDNTFRIDSSYPYAPVDYTAAYGACVDQTPHNPHNPHNTHNPPQPQRSYSVPYNPAEIASLPTAMPPVYPLSNMIQPQLVQYPVQYQDAVQWNPLQTQAMCPVVYRQHYAHYNILYPQVVPQTYPICQPVYPLLDTRRKRNSLPSSTRVTPIITTPEEKPYEKFDRQNSDIAAKINQIKEGMIQRESIIQREGYNRRRDDWKRNSGSGILGSYPASSYNGRISGATDNVQLSSAARAIVNSIRHLQAKNTYHQERRYDYNNYNNSYHRHYDKPDYRRRYEDRNDINGKGDGNIVDRHNAKDNNYTDKSNTQDRSNTQDGNSNAQDRKSNIQDTSNTRDKSSNAKDISCNIQDKSNGQDRSSNTQDRSNAQYRNNAQGRCSNIQDRNNTLDTSCNIQERNFVQDRNTGTQDKSSYTQDRSNAQYRNSNTQDRNSNTQEKHSNVQDISCNTQDRSNAQYRNSNTQDRSNTQDSCNTQDRSNTQYRNGNAQGINSNVQDINTNVYKHNYQDKSKDRLSNENRSYGTDTLNASNVTQEKSNTQDNSNTQDGSITQGNSVQERQSNAVDVVQESNAEDSTIQNTQERGYQDRNVHERNYHERGNYQERYHHERNYQDRPWQDRKYAPRNPGMNPGQYQYRAPYLFRQMSPATWCRRSPAPIHPGINHPRRPHPDNRNGRRY